MVGQKVMSKLKIVIAFDCCGVFGLAKGDLKVLAEAAGEGALLLLNFDVETVNSH